MNKLNAINLITANVKIDLLMFTGMSAAAVLFPRYLHRKSPVASTQQLRYACPHCGFPNKRKDHIYRHIRRKHPHHPVCYVELKQLIKKRNKKKYKSSFTIEKILFNPRIIRGNKNVINEVNLLMVSERVNHGYLDYYARSVRYSDMEKHPCPNCTRLYKRRSHMLRHYRYECGVPQRFECPYCGSRLRQRTQVWAHIKKLHQNSKLYCTDVMTRNVLIPQ